MAKSKDMAPEVFDSALRAALEDAAQARRRSTSHPWTPEIDAEILRASEVLRVSRRGIAEALKATHGWGSRSAVDERLRVLKAVRQ